MSFQRGLIWGCVWKTFRWHCHILLRVSCARVHTDRQALERHLLGARLSSPPFPLGLLSVCLTDGCSAWTGPLWLWYHLDSCLAVSLPFLLMLALEAFVQGFVVSVQDHHSSSCCSVPFSFWELPMLSPIRYFKVQVWPASVHVHSLQWLLMAFDTSHLSPVSLCVFTWLHFSKMLSMERVQAPES